MPLTSAYRQRSAARLLSAQLEDRTFRKEYLAVLGGVPESREGVLEDLLGYDRTARRAYVAREPGKEARRAVLRYRVLETNGGYALVSVALETGRTHQIRIQFASRGLPLVGDRKYGGADCPMEGIALWSHRLEFDHPQTGERMRFSAPPPEGAPWSRFAGWGNVDGNRG